MATDISTERNTSTLPEQNGHADNSQSANTHGSPPSASPSRPAEMNPALEKDITDRPYSVFTARQKVFIVLAATLGACFSPFTANIYLPAIDTISQALRVSVNKVNLTITTYMIMQGIAPSFISAIADEYGRRPAYVIGFAVYTLANLGLGLNDTYAGLLVLRCFQSAGSSGFVTLAYGSIADVVTSAERGKYISITSIASILAPIVAPIAGGALAQHLGWHSIFWTLLIASAVYFVALLLFFPETGRSVVGDGSMKPPRWNRCLTDITRSSHVNVEAAVDVHLSSHPDVRQHKKINLFGALTMILDPETAMLLLNISLNYAAYYAISTSLTVQFAKIYHLSPTLQGLLFIPLAVGTLLAAIYNSKSIDRRYRYHAERAGLIVDKTKQIDFLRSTMPIERARVDLAVPMLIVSALLTILYGWLLEKRVHIAGPMVVLFFLGFFKAASWSPLSTLVVDLNRSRPATASAASNLTRCLMGAGATAIVNPMIDAIGNGWTFTITALICLLSLPLLFVCATKGQQLRESRLAKETKRAKVEIERCEAKSSL